MKVFERYIDDITDFIYCEECYEIASLLGDKIE